MTGYTYVDNEDALRKEAEEWQNSKVIGIDIECENNLHHYGIYISIFQVSTASHNWIVDAINIKDLKPLIDVMLNPHIQKIFHDVGFDLWIIKHQYAIIPRNIFDTQLAAMLLGRTEVGLGALLKEFFHVEKEQKFQMADWTKRPLKKDMLAYATKDSAYLIKLRNILRDELEKKGRLEWARQEFANIKNKKMNFDEPTFKDLRGLRELTEQQRGIVKQLFRIRKQLAQKVDRPTHFIINNRKMLDLAQRPPPSPAAWEKMKGVHPIVHRQAKRFDDAVLAGRRDPVKLPAPIRKRYNPKQQRMVKKLSDRADALAEKLKMPKHLIINKDQIKELVLTGDWNVLRPWQRELVKK